MRQNAMKPHQDINDLIRAARKPTHAEVKAQRISSAYGTLAIENPRITRAMVEAAAERVGARTR